MARTFDDLCTAGANYCELYHVAGQDWCAVSDPRVIDTLFSGTTRVADAPARYYRRILFGTTARNSIFPCDKVQILPILNKDIGSQTVKYAEKKGIDTGSWKVTISRGETGYQYQNGTNECWGLPGLDWIVDTGLDGSVNMGRLYRDYDGHTLYWDNDRGLGARINALGVGEQLLLSLSHSTVLVDESDTATESGGVWTCVARGGALRSPDERVYKDTTDDNERIQIYDVPSAESLAGLAAYTWLIPINDDGSIIGYDPAAGSSADHQSPILFRHGMISANPSGSAGGWNINHNSISQMIDTKIPTERFSGHLSKYIFTRETTAERQLPHIGVVEFEKSSTGPFDVTTRTTQVYLCTAGNEVMYETQQELLEGIRDALNADATLDYDYSIQGNDIKFTAASGDDDPNVYVYGAAVLAAGLGYVRSEIEDYHAEDVHTNYSWHTLDSRDYDGSYQTVIREFRGFWKQLVALGSTAGNSTDPPIQYGWYIKPGGTLDKQPCQEGSQGYSRNASQCEYFYQFDYADPTYGAVGGTWNDGTGTWLIPEDGSGNRRLYFDAETDATLFNDNDELSLGNPDTSWVHYSLPAIGAATGLAYRWYPYATGIVDGTPSVETYIDVDDDELIGVDGSDLAGSAVPTLMSMARGFSLYWAPGYQATDPYLIADRRSISSDSPKQVFQTLLGDSSTGIEISRRIPITNIPDVVDVTVASDAKCAIDWDAWDQLDGAQIEIVFGSEDLTILKAMTACAFTHGFRMTYEYNELYRCFQLGLARIENETASATISEGRKLTTSDIKPEAPVDVISEGWMYSAIKIKAHKNVTDFVEVEAKRSVGRTSHITQAKTLEIVDPVSVFPDVDGQPNPDLLAQARRFAFQFSTPVVNQGVQLVVSPMARIAVGKPALITWGSLMNSSVGRRDGTEQSALTVQATYSLSGLPVQLRISKTKYGPSGSMFITGSDMTAISSDISTITGQITDPANNYFASKTGGLTDLATFGCFDYNNSIGSVVARDCSCTTGYRAQLFLRHQTASTDAGASRNVWHVTVRGYSTALLTLDDLTNGRFRLDFADKTNFDTLRAVAGSEFVLIFEQRTHANLTSCQLAYGNLGDSDGLVQDSTAANFPAIQWS